MDSPEKSINAPTLRITSARLRVSCSSIAAKMSASTEFSDVARVALTTTLMQSTKDLTLIPRKTCQSFNTMNNLAKFVASMLTEMSLRSTKIREKPCSLRSLAWSDPRLLVRPLLEKPSAKELTWNLLTTMISSHQKALRTAMKKSRLSLSSQPFLRRSNQGFFLKISLRANSKPSSLMLTALLLHACLSFNAPWISVKSAWTSFHRLIHPTKHLLFFPSASASITLTHRSSFLIFRL